VIVPTSLCSRIRSIGVVTSYDAYVNFYNYFRGVTDLFSIMLPGAVISGLIYQVLRIWKIPSEHLLAMLVELHGPAGWLSFGVSAYVLGHVVAIAGSRLDISYRMIEESHRNSILHMEMKRVLDVFIGQVQSFGQVYSLLTEREIPAGKAENPSSTDSKGSEAEGGPSHEQDNAGSGVVPGVGERSVAWNTPPIPLPAGQGSSPIVAPQSPQSVGAFSFFRRLLLGLRPHVLFLKLVTFVARGSWRRESDLGINASEKNRLIDDYGLARVVLNRHAPMIFSEVDRLESDSKFFRGFSVVAAFGVIACLIQTTWDLGLVFVEQDWKRAAYGFFYLSITVLMLRIAFARFCELKMKAIETALQGLLVVVSDHILVTPSNPGRSPKSDSDRSTPR
jgi:hypothetical protein